MAKKSKKAAPEPGAEVSPPVREDETGGRLSEDPNLKDRQLKATNEFAKQMRERYQKRYAKSHVHAPAAKRRLEAPHPKKGPDAAEPHPVI